MIFSRLLFSMALTGVVSVATGCSSSVGGDDDLDGGGVDAGQFVPGTLPDAIPNVGVAFVAHFLPDPDSENKLLWFRTDGTTPSLGGSIALDAPTQAMVLDRRNNLLGIVSDAGRSVTLYKISKPASASDPMTAPVKSGRLMFETDEVPVAVVFNDVSKRMYVGVAPVSGQPTPMHQLHAYDVSNPDSPTPISGFPVSIPASVYFALDGARNILFIGGLADDKLHGYDLDDTGLRPLPGSPLDLPVLFPEPVEAPSQTAFQVRDTTVDPWRNRVYAVRSQGILSELMAFEYPDSIPGTGERYGDTVSMDDFTLLSDGFDTSVAAADRPNLLDGYGVGLDTENGDIFMLGDAFNGSLASAIVANFKASDLSLQPGCDDFESFGCFVRTYSDNIAGSFLRTDGALCYDSTHKVVVATSVATPEDDPGKVHFYNVGAGQTLGNWLASDGNTIRASALPVEAVCY